MFYELMMIFGGLLAVTDAGFQNQFLQSDEGFVPQQDPGLVAQPGFQPFQSFDNTVFNQQFNKIGQSTGNAAAAGNAGTSGDGAVSSINQASQQGTKDLTQASGLSANTATGFGSTAGGAVQAGGTINSASKGFQQTGFQAGLQGSRRRRGVDVDPGNTGVFPSFPAFPSFQSQSEVGTGATGGGSAATGQVGTQNRASSFNTPLVGFGTAKGSSVGTGQGVSIFQSSQSGGKTGGTFPLPF